MIAVRPVADEQELHGALAVRRAVFVDEQGVPDELEYDEHDADADHLVALDGDAVVGTCRLLHRGSVCKLGRMAVLPGARRRGVASRLLALAERRAHDRGARRMALSAQVTVVDLYERAGYTAHGTVYLDAGIDHIAMDKPLHA